MVKRTQNLPISTIVLAIIAIVVLVFLIGNFIPQPPIQPTPPPCPRPPLHQTNSTQCTIYAITIDVQMGTYTNSSVQLQMLANSQYVTSNCSISTQYAFTLYNGSQVVCGLGPNYNISTSSGTIYGCEIQ